VKANKANRSSWDSQFRVGCDIELSHEGPPRFKLRP